MPNGDRKNEGKPEISMVLEAQLAVKECAKVLMFGKEKYDRGNWRNGLSWTQTADSLLRHLTAFLSGEDDDPESGLPHTAHVMCNALFLAEMYHQRPDLDDRSKLKYEQEVLPYEYDLFKTGEYEGILRNGVEVQLLDIIKGNTPYPMVVSGQINPRPHVRSNITLSLTGKHQGGFCEHSFDLIGMVKKAKNCPGGHGRGGALT
jgi:hypothetical protein